MWTRCGSRISLRRPEACPLPSPSSTSSSSAPGAGGSPSPVTWPVPTLVLGSTQPTELVDAARLQAARRRAGPAARRGRGGLSRAGRAALARRLDPARRPAVGRRRVRRGRVGRGVVDGGACRPGPARLRRCTRADRCPGALGDLVCFAGRGPGEVFQGGRKVVGLSQWRAREGALFSSCAYLRWDPVPLLALMDVDARTRAELAGGLALAWRAGWPSWSRRCVIWRRCAPRCWTRSPTSGDGAGDAGRLGRAARSSSLRFSSLFFLLSFFLLAPSSGSSLRRVVARAAGRPAACSGAGGPRRPAPRGSLRAASGSAGAARGFQLCCSGS